MSKSVNVWNYVLLCHIVHIHIHWLIPHFLIDTPSRHNNIIRDFHDIYRNLLKMEWNDETEISRLTLMQSNCCIVTKRYVLHHWLTRKQRFHEVLVHNNCVVFPIVSLNRARARACVRPRNHTERNGAGDISGAQFYDPPSETLRVDGRRVERAT